MRPSLPTLGASLIAIALAHASPLQAQTTRDSTIKVVVPAVPKVDSTPRLVSVQVWDRTITPGTVTYKDSVIKVPVPATGLPIAGAVWYTDWSQQSQAVKAADDPHGLLAVVPAVGLGFPPAMAQVLRVTHPKSGPVYGHVVSPALWPKPQVGETRYFRVYLASFVANDEPAGTASQNSHHPVEDVQFNAQGGGSSAENFEFETGPRPDGGLNFYVGLIRNEGTGPTRFHAPAPLRKFAAYRIEWSLKKVAANSYLVELRVYDQLHDSSLLYGTGAFLDNNGNSPMAATVARHLNDSQLNLFWLGTNGGSNFSGLLRDEFDYYGGICVRSDTWCGAYLPGEAAAH